MIKDKFGQYIYDEDDVSDIIMQGIDITSSQFLVNGVDVSNVNNYTGTQTVVQYVEPSDTVFEFDRKNQENWYMPNEYKDLDIAEYILSECNTDAELQRCGYELIMYQERSLFNLLKYMKYLVDTMIQNNIIWGVGRGSSVSSYVLYKLEVHKIDSIFYNLDVGEFLR